MTTVPPSINPALPQMLANAVASAPPATIAAPPPALVALKVGATFQGVATPTPDPRVVLLATTAGDVSLRTPAPLPEGATLTLEVVRATPAQINVRLIAIDGAPVQMTAQPPANTVAEEAPPEAELAAPPALPLTPGAPPPLPAGFAWWPGGAQPITALPVMSGFVVNAPQAAATTPQLPTAPNSVPATAPTLPSLTVGADVALRVVGVTLPSGGAAPPQPAIAPTPQPATPPPGPNAVLTAATPPASQATLLPTTSPPNAPAPAAASPSVAPAPTIVVAPTPQTAQPSITIANLSPGAPQIATPTTAPGLVLPRDAGWPLATPAPPTTVQAAMPLATLAAPVIANTDGVPTIQLGEAEVQLNLRANLPVGSTVTIELRGVQPPLTPLPAPPLPPPALQPLSLAQPSWPSLNDSLAVLQRADPAAAQALSNAIPDGGPRTAVAMISFVQAMRTGDARQWPGDATLQALERASPRGAHLAGQLGAEIEDLSRQVRDAGTEWRALPIPWQNEGRVERIRMVVRETDPDEQAEARKKGGGGVRFLLDLDLSRLGPMQLDGIFRKETRQLDLTIRTKAALPDSLRQELTGVFTGANAAMNLAGVLSFQVTRTFPDPVPANPKADKSGLWV